MDQTPKQYDHESLTIGGEITAALLKNILLIVGILFGVTVKYYIINKSAVKIKPLMCWLSIFIAGLAGSIAFLLVKDLNIHPLYKAIACGYSPIVIEPLTLRIILWINPIVDEIGKAIKSFIKKQSK